MVGGVTANLEELSVPLMTSERADFKACMDFSHLWKLAHRLEASNIVRKRVVK